ncbi:MAG: hypothetical protein NW224_03445 [Leptolyngbyaceae cyanobacterium bins.302]|nr:hypothetical protein [Leptolyngbyaceae cyanobacterium bins.302]
MSELSDRKAMTINALPEYEMKLLTALSFFLGRSVSSQATAALAMYVRQSHDRILTQTEYYAHRAGMNKWDFFDLIYENPQKAQELMQGTGAKIHAEESDVFSDLIPTDAEDE